MRDWYFPQLESGSTKQFGFDLRSKGMASRKAVLPQRRSTISATIDREASATEVTQAAVR
jgi:hypothetical protein